ncbi:hypothetical protein A2U01_0074240 [Trifolium medium]|uniref:Uncharacterized protein n=1 Tax=Trifolium medium TaxID=97028 RepID=A0A392SXP8_9FABA|nr:hypothetical protein [Trifolium medium]
MEGFRRFRYDGGGSRTVHGFLVLGGGFLVLGALFTYCSSHSFSGGCCEWCYSV